MKLACVLAMSAAMVLAPVAQAQISCVDGQNVIEAALDDFDGLTGESIGDGVFATTASLDGAAGCQITFDLSAAYACMWTFDTLAAAQANYGMQSGIMADCFDDWEREPLDESSSDPKTTTLEGTTFFLIDDDDAEFTWIAFIEEHIEGDTHDWHVWVGLDYY